MIRDDPVVNIYQHEIYVVCTIGFLDDQCTGPIGIFGASDYLDIFLLSQYACQIVAYQGESSTIFSTR